MSTYKEIREKQDADLAKLLGEIRKVKSALRSEYSGKYYIVNDSEVIHYWKVIDAWVEDEHTGVLTVDVYEVDLELNSIGEVINISCDTTIKTRKVNQNEMEEHSLEEMKSNIEGFQKTIMERLHME